MHREEEGGRGGEEDGLGEGGIGRERREGGWIGKGGEEEEASWRREEEVMLEGVRREEVKAETSWKKKNKGDCGGR